MGDLWLPRRLLKRIQEIQHALARSNRPLSSAQRKRLAGSLGALLDQNGDMVEYGPPIWRKRDMPEEEETE